MVDDKPEPTEPPPDLGRPKRTPPTIDLDPSEISREESAAPAEPHEAASESPVNDEPSEPRQRTPWIPSAIVAAVVSAIIAGGAIGVSSWAGWLTPPQAVPAAPQVERASVDALAARVATIESKPAAPAVVDSTLAGRITAIEQSVAGLRKDVANLTAQEEKSTATINDLKSAPRENASASPDLSAVTARLDQIEGATRALSSASAQRDAAPADDKPLRRVVAATLLDQLVRQGESYGAALTAAKPLASKPEQLKPLDRFAASGVPSANALCKELLTLIAGIVPAEPKVAEASGIVDRLKAGAERLVRIRRTGPQSGEGQAAILSRAAAAARLDDVATARRELNGLAAADRAPVQPWIEKADARDAALAASRQLAADATAALSKPAP
jgi:hypothetical protein